MSNIIFDALISTFLHCRSQISASNVILEGPMTPTITEPAIVWRTLSTWKTAMEISSGGSLSMVSVKTCVFDYLKKFYWKCMSLFLIAHVFHSEDAFVAIVMILIGFKQTVQLSCTCRVNLICMLHVLKNDAIDRCRRMSYISCFHVSNITIAEQKRKDQTFSAWSGMSMNSILHKNSPL